MNILSILALIASLRRQVAVLEAELAQVQSHAQTVQIAPPSPVYGKGEASQIPSQLPWYCPATSTIADWNAFANQYNKGEVTDRGYFLQQNLDKIGCLDQDKIDSCGMVEIPGTNYCT